MCFLMLTYDDANNTLHSFILNMFTSYVATEMAFKTRIKTRTGRSTIEQNLWWANAKWRTLAVPIRADSGRLLLSHSGRVADPPLRPPISNVLSVATSEVMQPCCFITAGSQWRYEKRQSVWKDNLPPGGAGTQLWQSSRRLVGCN